MSKIAYVVGGLCLGLGLLLAGCKKDEGNNDRVGAGATTANSGGDTTSGSGGKPATQKTGGMMNQATGGVMNQGTGGMVMAQTGGMMEIIVPPVEDNDPFRTNDPARNDVTAGNVCDRVTQLQCAAEQTCCSNPGRTFADCYTKLVESCRNEAYLDAMTGDPITGFDQARARAAMAEFETLAMACDLSLAQWGESADGLRGIMQGTRTAGTSCLPLSAKREVAAANLASCQNPAEVSCLPETTIKWTCTARGDVDATCVTDLNCKVGLYCPQADYQNPQLDSNCAQRLADGSPCISNNECMSFACKSGACAPLDKDAAYCLD